MEGYFEQSVSGRRTMHSTILYALCWALIVLLALATLFFLLNVVSVGEDGTALRWPCIVGALVCLGLGVLVFRRKDYLRIEYDYLLREGALEIWGILNLRRRRKLARIPLERISRMGPAQGSGFESARRQPGLKRHDWHAEGDALQYVCYTQENVRHMAILELNDEMRAQMRGSGRILPGVWQDGEGKNIR